MGDKNKSMSKSQILAHFAQKNGLAEKSRCSLLR